MDIRLLLFLMGLLFYCPNFIHSQCDIRNVILDKTTCDMHGRFFMLAHFETALDSVEILGNGINYGKFSSNQQPVMLGPLKADCTTNYGVLIRDFKNPNCSVFQSLGVNCCTDNCFVDIVESFSFGCRNNSFNLSIDYKTNDDGDSIVVLRNNQSIGVFDNDGLPLILWGLNLTDYSQEYNLVVCSYNNRDCCDTIKMPAACSCAINDFRYEITDCNSLDSTFSLWVDFKHEFTSGGFRIGGNAQNYGSYNYNELPIKITGLKSKTGLDYEFIVVDNQSSLCFSAFELGIVESCDLECQLIIEDIKFYGCDDEKVAIRMKMSHENSSINGFHLVIDNQIINTTIYNKKGVYHFGPLSLPCDLDHNLQVIDSANGLCIDSFVVPIGTCCASDSCTLSGLNVEEICGPDGIASLIIDFDALGDNSQFSLIINGDTLGIFNYSHFPIKINNPALSQEYFIEIINTSNEDCEIDSLFKSQCPTTCRIVNFSLDVKDCENENAHLELNFELSGNSSNSFLLLVNDEIVDTLEFSQRPWGFNYSDAQCDEKILVSIMSLESNCSLDTFYILGPCCSDSCIIGDIKIKEFCSDNKLDSLQLDFEHNSTGDSFQLFINNELWAELDYSSLPYMIRDIEEFEGETYVKVVDNTYEDCTAELIWIQDCMNNESNCGITELVYNILPCDSVDFNHLELDFSYNEVSDSFFILIGEDLFYTGEYKNLPITLSGFGNDKEYQLHIKDSKDSLCSATIEFTTWDCLSSANFNQNLEPQLWAAHKTIYIESPIVIDEVSVWSIIGTPLYISQQPELKSTINLPHLPTGIYWVMLKSGRTIYSFKVVL